MNNPLRAAIALASLTALAPVVTADDTEIEEVMVFGQSTTFANNQVTAAMMRQQSPITSSLALVDNLPGISVQEGDTFGFDDWSTTISMRGFQNSLSEQQLGITIDGLPNGNSNYGGGAKANRYIDNQNIAGVNVSQGTADVSSLSNEALGGTLDFRTIDPAVEAGLNLSVTGAEFDGQRFYVRYDTGAIMDSETYAYVSFSQQEATDWVNQSAQNQRDHLAVKLISALNDKMDFTGYLSYDDTHEDNYQRLFSATDFERNKNDDQLTSEWSGIPHVDQLYRRGWSTLRENFFTYGKLDWAASDNLTLDVSLYYHKNKGRGDWVPPYLVDIVDDAGGAESELGDDTINGGSSIGLIYAVNAAGVAQTPIAGCESSINFPYGGTGPAGDPGCYAAGAIPVQSYRHTHYGKERLGISANGEWIAQIGGFENSLRGGIWWEDYEREEYRDWHKIIDTRRGYEFNEIAYWRQYDRKYPQDTFKYYLEDTLTLGAVDLSLGIKQFLVDLDREDIFGETPNASVNSDSDVLFSGGVIWRTPVDGMELFGSYAENFSAISDNILERPLSDISQLEPETAENIDFGVRYAGSRFNVQATYYDISFENRIIFLAPNTASGPDYLIGTDGTYFNAGGIDSDGIELSGDFDVMDNVNIFVSYTNNTSEYLGTGDPLVDAAIGITPGNDVVAMPDTMYVIGGDWRNGAFNAGFSSKYTGDRWVDVGNTWEAEAYTLTDVYLGYAPQDLSGWMRGLSVNLVVNNVTNERYLGGISGGGAWLGAPRTASISVSFDFSALQ